MKVDEFITVYKLLQEQNYWTLPFTILFVVGMFWLIYEGFTKIWPKEGPQNSKKKWISKYGVLTYILLLIFSLCLVIMKRDKDENLRVDALRVKQYIDDYAGEYEVVSRHAIITSLKNYNIDSLRLNDIAERFPNDFTITPTDQYEFIKVKTKDSKKETNIKNRVYSVVLRDTAIMNKYKRFVENLAYCKLKANLEVGKTECINFLSKDARMSNKLIEKICVKHSDEFALVKYEDNDFCDTNYAYLGKVKRIR